MIFIIKFLDSRDYQNLFVVSSSWNNMMLNAHFLYSKYVIKIYLGIDNSLKDKNNNNLLHFKIRVNHSQQYILIKPYPKTV